MVPLLWSRFVPVIYRSGVFGYFTSIAPPQLIGPFCLVCPYFSREPCGSTVMVTFRNCSLQEWFLWTLFFYCPSAVFRHTFVLCARLLYRNHVVRPLCSPFLTEIYMSGVFGNFNLDALTAVYMRCVFALRTRDTFTNRDLPVRCFFVSYC